MLSLASESEDALDELCTADPSDTFDALLDESEASVVSYTVSDWLVASSFAPQAVTDAAIIPAAKIIDKLFLNNTFLIIKTSLFFAFLYLIPSKKQKGFIFFKKI